VIDPASVCCWGEGLCPVPVCKPVSIFITAPEAQLKDIAAKVIGEYIAGIPFFCRHIILFLINK